MNDVDKDKLEQLSLALQRRFHIIRMDSPSPGNIGEIIAECWGKSCEKNKNSGLRALFKDLESKPNQEIGDVSKALKNLFYNPPGNLLSKHIISMAQVLDIIHFALRRCYVSKGCKIKLNKKLTDDFILTGLALGIVTKVYPQLQNFLHDDAIIKQVIDLLVCAFGKNVQMVFASDKSQNPKLIRNFLHEEFNLQFKRIVRAYDETIWQDEEKINS